MATLQQPERGAGRRTECAVGLLLAALVATTLPASGHAADINKGAELYRLHCAACHGGDGGDGRPLMPGATDFSRPSSLLKPDLALLGVMRAGKGAMPAYQGQLRDREMLDIIAHLRTHQ
jgi:mono/diheme cytochrome c family protein